MRMWYWWGIILCMIDEEKNNHKPLSYQCQRWRNGLTMTCVVWWQKHHFFYKMSFISPWSLSTFYNIRRPTEYGPQLKRNRAPTAGKLSSMHYITPHRKTIKLLFKIKELIVVGMANSLIFIIFIFFLERF